MGVFSKQIKTAAELGVEMEEFNGGQTHQSSFTVVSDIYKNENNNNCFLREDCFIDFNSLVTDLDIDEVKAESKEEVSNSRDTSETESATEEVEEIDIRLISDDMIVFQSEDEIKEAYPNLQIYNESQKVQQTYTVVNDPNNETKYGFNYNSVHYREDDSLQGLANTVPQESHINSESMVLNEQDHSGSTFEPTYYYVDSFPLTKNPPDIADDSNYDETNLEGSYTVERASSTQSASNITQSATNILQIPKEEPNEIEHYAAEESDNNIVIISMKKFILDEFNQVKKQPLKKPIAPLIPTHKWKRLYECFQCGKKFSHSVNLNIHMEVHTHELHPHKCVQCGVSFAKSSQLLRHLKKHTAPKKKNLDCPICEATYKTHGHLRHHLIVVHGVENVNPNSIQSSAPKNSSAQILIVKPNTSINSTNLSPYSFETGIDNFIKNCYTSQESLKEKNNDSFTAKNLLKCPICDKTYKSRGSFKKHVRLHNEKEFSRNGVVCDDQFLFQNEKKEHEMIVHTRQDIVSFDRQELMPISSELSVKCSTCGSRFGDFLTMIKHKKTSHRPFRCRNKFCKAKFSHRHLLNRHRLQSHSKNHVTKHFKCHTCGYPFTSKSNLNVHWNIDFPLGKPYRCAVCFSAMIAKSNLERHRCNL